MIRMAFETPRFRMVRARRMARLAQRNPRNQNVRRLRTLQRILVASGARKSPVRVMIESGMRQPLQSNIRVRNLRKAGRELRSIRFGTG